MVLNSQILDHDYNFGFLYRINCIFVKKIINIDILQVGCQALGFLKLVLMVIKLASKASTVDKQSLDE